MRAIEIKEYFLRLNVDEIWCEDTCSDKVNAHSIRILLNIIATEITRIQCYSDQFFCDQE